MTKEQIEKAALQCAKDRWGDSESQHVMAKAQGTVYGFKQGAQWRINSVWHDKSERPEVDRNILTYFGTNCFEIDFLHKEDFDWEYYADKSGIVRWAYIDDLLPERKED